MRRQAGEAHLGLQPADVTGHHASEDRSGKANGCQLNLGLVWRVIPSDAKRQEDLFEEPTCNGVQQ